MDRGALPVLVTVASW
jgi:hypothetical protein